MPSYPAWVFEHAHVSKSHSTTVDGQIVLAFADFQIDFEFEFASLSEFPITTLRVLEVLSSDFAHPHLAIYKNMVIVSLYMATPIPYTWPW